MPPCHSNLHLLSSKLGCGLWLELGSASPARYRPSGCAFIAEAAHLGVPTHHTMYATFNNPRAPAQVCVQHQNTRDTSAVQREASTPVSRARVARRWHRLQFYCRTTRPKKQTSPERPRQPRFALSLEPYVLQPAPTEPEPSPPRGVNRRRKPTQQVSSIREPSQSRNQSNEVYLSPTSRLSILKPRRQSTTKPGGTTNCARNTGASFYIPAPGNRATTCVSLIPST